MNKKLPEAEFEAPSLTRRQWLSRLPIPIVAAAAFGPSIGVAALSVKTSPSNTNDLGVRTYNVRDCGAKGDGSALDTNAVQAANENITIDGGDVSKARTPLSLKMKVTAGSVKFRA